MYHLIDLQAIESDVVYEHSEVASEHELIIISIILLYSGLDNRCSVYKVDERFSGEGQVARITMPRKSLQEHSKYVTHVAFFGSDQQLLTSSADTTCALWDMEQKEPVRSFQGHKLEVLG